MRKLAIIAAIMFASTAAPAQTANEAQAKMLFASGAEAYASGQYKAAIQAFSEANRILPRPAIMFSLAQAHRRQYVMDKDADHVHEAVRLFRAYLQAVQEGGRRNEAAQALEQLEPLEQKMVDAGKPPAAAAPAKEPARLMVTSRPAGANVSIDGKPGKATPYGAEVTPGKHKVAVSSPGFFDEEREVLAIDNALVPVPVDLREKPARLSVDAPPNAQVSVDGRFVGITPLPGPVEVPSGSHYVVVTKNGFRAFTQDVDVAHDEKRVIQAKLGATGQRIIANSLLATGLVGVVVGGVFTAISLHHEGTAQDILDARSTRNLTDADVADYESAVRARNGWRTASYVAFGVGGAALLTGIVFYVFDQPTVNAAATRSEPKPKPASPPPPSMDREPTEMSFAPLLGPGLVGGGLHGRF